MSDLRARLRDADPLATEDPMSADHVRTIRRSIVAAASQPSPQQALWPRPMLVAATVAVTLAAGVVIGWRLPVRVDAVRGARPVASAPAVAAASSELRQLQFATSGGTRIIWVFDPEFNP